MYKSAVSFLELGGANVQQEEMRVVRGESSSCIPVYRYGPAFLEITEAEGLQLFKGCILRDLNPTCTILQVPAKLANRTPETESTKVCTVKIIL